jgi:hypothetical protein
MKRIPWIYGFIIVLLESILCRRGKRFSKLSDLRVKKRKIDGYRITPAEVPSAASCFPSLPWNSPPIE